MTYVNGMVMAVPTAKKADFSALAQEMKPIFTRHGAREVVDCWGDDVPEGKVTSFPMAVKCEPDETVVFSWITWPDKASADKGMKAAMDDPEMTAKMANFPYDGQRMIYGGFEQL